jgi:hypothetical protein
MKTVNQYFLSELLNPLIGGADDDELYSALRNLNVNNEMVIKKLIRENLHQYFKQKPDAYKEAAKRALSYYLTTNKADFERIFNSALTPLDTPDNSQLFFQWIWEVFWEGEDYNILDVSSYKETDDIREPIRLSMKK